ncbi:DnaB-like helicase C-terminal domain-containing protein [Glaesserella parasuis]|uniref:DnaB-like helicase C-terminal domain-containing protein n=1 Tax=Glaesserella parasuis TaxID=738 RepID=UPI000479F3FC|nr:DnaB-like helicase C-terminal domain-containing protein [Glaesserella parasuis]AIK16394.1 DNA helicase [Glaesserella parasuis]AIK16860.1 DNA helicase [Glaesserella parasuis]KDD80032.1 DNA helicase [Glaesserella parasuis ST4-1]KDD80269.1 DNA helicase [Glaesserella parasuis ST4-2]MCT8547067.1 replicative DNA helicase [Glaesserella parasuis]
MSENLRKITYEVEVSTVGSLLNGGLTAQAREVLSWLKPEMFLTFKLGEIYSNIQRQASKDNLIDMLLLSSEYGVQLADMAETIKSVVSASNLTGYATKVFNFYQRREVLKVLVSLAGELNLARDEQLDAIATKGVEHISALLNKSASVAPTGMGSLLDGYYQLLQDRHKPEFKRRLLFTGIQALDDILQGIDETDICVVGGRSGNGKTETAITFTKNILEQGGSVLFFSLEMSRQQIMDRLIASASGVNSAKLRNPEWLSDEDFARMSEATSVMKDQKLFVVDKGALSVEEITAITERHLAEHKKLNAVVVDYIGLVNHGALDGRVNRTYQIGETVERLKAFSKQVHVPFILLSQLSRDAEGSTPNNANLSDSKALENVASQIIMVHNQRDKETNEPARYTHWIVTKNRNGKVGTAYVEFQNGRFIECDQALAWESFQKKNEQQRRANKGF